MRRCRACGCTELSACKMPDGGPCWWVAEDLCAACAVNVDEDTVDDDGDGFERDERTGLWLPTGSHEA